MKRMGFTLIELTVVMAIIALLLTMAVGAHYAWKRASALDTAEVRVVSALSLARQQAMATGRPTVFAYGNGTVPYADESLRTTLDLSSTMTNAYSGWCCVVALTNALEEADAWDLLEGDEKEFPIVGAPVVFPEPLLWGDMDGIDEGDEVQCFLALPDGGFAFEDDKSSAGAVTNAIFGLQEEELKRFKTAQTRLLEILPCSGTVRALTRDERAAAWNEEQ